MIALSSSRRVACLAEAVVDAPRSLSRFKVIRVRLEAHMLLPVNKNADVFRNHITGKITFVPRGLSILPSDEIALAIASQNPLGRSMRVGY